MRQVTINIHRRGTLLALFAVGVLVVGLLALMGAKPALAVSRSFESASNSPFAVGSTPTTVTNADFNADGKMDLPKTPAPTQPAQDMDLRHRK